MCFMCRFIFLILFIYSNGLIAQLKIGKSPKVVENNTYLQIESDASRQLVVSKDSSKLGIGTTSPNFSLEMIGINNNDAIAVGNAVLGSSFRGKISVLGSGANDRWMRFNSDWTTTTNNTRAFGFFRGTNEYFTILDNGNVGVAINNPTFKFQVRGNARFTPNTLNDGTGEPVTIDIYGRAPTATATQVGGIRLGWYNTFGGIEVLRGPSALGVGLAFNYANTSSGATVEGMRLSFNGNLSIGTTSETNLLNLRIDSAASSTSGIDFSLRNSNNILSRVNTLKNSNSNAGILTFHTNSNGGLFERMRIDSNGNVGIGTNVASWLLDVRKTSSSSELIAHFVNPSSTTTAESQIGIGAGPGAWTKIVGYNGTLGFRNYSTNTEFITLKTGNGNVGIGSTDPISKFEVNGSATNTTAFNAAAGTTIDFSRSNLAYTTANPGAFTLTNIKDGGTYTLAVRGTISGTASFTSTGFTFKSVNNGITVSGKETLYTFLVMGTTVYFYMASGF